MAARRPPRRIRPSGRESARFPADQVILLDEKRELEIRFDDAMKTSAFPFWQIEALTPRSS